MKTHLSRATAVLSLAAALVLVACQPPTSTETPVTKPVSLLTLKAVPAGTYQRDETSGNTTTVSAFQMSEAEITRDQFTTVTGLSDPSNVVYSTGTSDPVQGMTWYQTLVFCNKLSLREGLTPVYSVSGKTDPGTWGVVPSSSNATWDSVQVNWNADGYRLPTEAEWMWAAMGAQGTYAKAFAGSTGSNSANDYAWTRSNASGTSHPVKGKLPNELGLYDLSGNVWERIWDWYEAAPAAGATTDHRGPATGTERTIRGGAWYDSDVATLKVAGRNKIAPGTPDSVIGFRVVRGSGNYAAVAHYTLTFDGNGADGGSAPAAVTGEASSSVVLPNNSFSRSGFVFGGWEIWRAGAEVAEATLAAGSTVVLTSNTTARASWLFSEGPSTTGPKGRP